MEETKDTTQNERKVKKLSDFFASQFNIVDAEKKKNNENVMVGHIKYIPTTLVFANEEKKKNRICLVDELTIVNDPNSVKESLLKVMILKKDEIKPTGSISNNRPIFLTRIGNYPDEIAYYEARGFVKVAMGYKHKPIMVYPMVDGLKECIAEHMEDLCIIEMV